MRGNHCGQAGWRPVPSTARVTRDGVSGIMKVQFQLSGRQYLNAQRIRKEPLLHICSMRYCLPDSSFFRVCNPETLSRVTLALLGIGFQPNPLGWFFVSCSF